MTALQATRSFRALATAMMLMTASAAAQQTSPAPPDIPIELVQFQQVDPIAPTERRSGSSESDGRRQLTNPEQLFGTVNQLDLLSEHRRRLAQSPAANAVFGSESKGRVSTDVGNLLRKSISSQGVSSQDRTPIVTDTRVRGQRTGQILASGSFWAPVRMDLDTMMNKIDSRLIDDIIVIKGPYSARYGPGFRFVDFDLISTPRYDSYEAHGATSLDYDTNGEQVYGRQSLWGGADDWGYFVSYGHRTGNDYRTGAGTSIPASYNSRDLFVAIGWDTSPHEHFEFNYLRLDQTGVEFPGLVYDLNYLVTDGYEIKYVNTAPEFGDRIDAEVWYNQTRFAGDTLRPGKARQIPTLSTTLYSDTGFDGFAITDAEGQSMGYRAEATFGRPGQPQSSFGVDLTSVRQFLNDVEPLIPDPDDNNFPIPQSYTVDGGLFWENIVPVNDDLTITAGSRVDIVATDAESWVDGLPARVEELLDTDSLQKDYFLWSLFLTAQLQLDDTWSMTFGAGHGQRPPTLTELYTISSFIGSLQRGLTAMTGDPELDPERLTQIDLGLEGRYENLRVGAHGYYSWISDLITYELVEPSGGAGGLGGFPQSAQYVNTDQAIITGFEVYGEHDVRPWLTSFATMSYVEGRDLSRDAPSRFGSGGRSGVTGRPHEPLPGMTPLETRLGLRFHDPAPQQKWGVELAARIVDDQDRVADSLEEIKTPGFTTYDIRVFRRHGNWLFTSGVENLTDRFYREHLDYRSGLGVFRPGINFYSGVEVTY